MNKELWKRYILLIFVVVSSLFSIAYMTFLTLTVFQDPVELTLSYLFVALVVFAGIFNVVGASYYFNSYFQKDAPPQKPVSRRPSVALVVASYNEDPAVVRKALASLQKMDYPKKLLKLYLLDDSNDSATILRLRKICNALGVVFLHRDSRTNFKAGALNEFLKHTREEYFALFDADEELADPQFLNDLLPFFAADSKLVSIQTIKRSRPSRTFASAVDETYAFFYRFIQPLRSRDKAAMFQGSAGLLRTSHVKAAGGFPPSLTEDTAMSFQADLRGFHAIFVPKTYVLGKPIEKFSSFLVQQNRYSYGNAALVKDYAKNFARLSSRKRMHYFTQVFGLQYISAVYVFFAILTVLFSLLGISRLIFSGEAFWQFAPRLQFSDLLPMLMTLASFLIVANFFFSRFRVGAVGYFLNFAVALVRMRAILNAMFGRKAFFVSVGDSAQGKRSWPKAVRLTLRETSFAVALLLFAVSSFLHADLVSGLWLSYYSLLFFSAPVFAYIQG